MYNSLAPYYDLIHAEFADDIPFILSLAERVKGPILELGCGSGRLLLPLAAAGKRVVGLDNSPEMLQRAREKLDNQPRPVRERVVLREDSAVGFSLGEHFDLILLAFNMSMHLDAEQMAVALGSARDHLNPGGLLFIDQDDPQAIETSTDDHALQLERTMADERADRLVVQLSSQRVDRERQVLHVTWIFDVSPRRGGAVSRTVMESDYHYRFAHQLEIALSEANLALEATYGGYDRRPYGEGADRLLAIARLEP